MPAFKIIAKAAVSFYDELFNISLMGFVTLVACALILIAPFVFVNPAILNPVIASTGDFGALLFAVFAIAVASLPGAFAIAGLYAACQKTVRGEGMKWHHYWAGVKEFGLRTWLLWIGLVAGLGIAAINVYFYNTPGLSPFSPTVARILTPLWVLAALLWILVHIYVQPYLMELVEPKAKHIYRNSAFQVLLHPVTTIILLVTMILALALSIVLPVLLIFGPAFILTLGLTAVRELTADVEERAKRFEEEDQKKDAEEEIKTQDE